MKIFSILLFAFVLHFRYADGQSTYAQLRKDFINPPAAAKPWVFWYWMQAAVSREGITADLEAMKQSGIAGAYLMPIKGAANPPVFQPVTEQLSPEWWKMVDFALKEADRLHLKLAMHISDGFALAGGPWISPEESMQKLVSLSVTVSGGKNFSDTLAKPMSNENYYEDVAIYAYPSPFISDFKPSISYSKASAAAIDLSDPQNQQTYKSDDSCWFQYSFSQPFTCRSIFIKTDGRNYYANRLIISVSDNGRDFREYTRLEAPRSGWQDNDAGVTHAIASVTAKYFRFTYDKSGAEPGAEDLDAAKWKASLNLRCLLLSASPKVHQFEGKNGEVWRVSPRSNEKQLPDSVCVPLDQCINISGHFRNGRLDWDVPAGRWTILRIGHTSTGHRNDTGGGGKGLECDKFNEAAIRSEFDHWFGEAVKRAGPELTSRVLNTMHIDSWECGSQNWTEEFPREFQKRRGYDMMPYLPVMTGVPMGSALVSEQFLSDVRQTIADLVVDVFYKTFSDLAHSKGAVFSAESVAPTMLSDGLAHYNEVDIPMGEFWLNSPTHDKPNDMMDAISGAHIYGKRIIQAEAFTEVRMAWNESPQMLKTLGDRNYALGINRFVYHVFTHNPWMDRKPGMTLGDGVGLFFQRDQTWFKQGRAWVDYAARCQSVLQPGDPVTDLAVFIGEELPRRSILPDRLVPVLPGLFAPEVAAREIKRLENAGQPTRQKPIGVTHSANMADPEDWTDALQGYNYDSFNRDVILKRSTVLSGKVKMVGKIPYSLLVVPGASKMSPTPGLMSPEVARKLLTLVVEGATVLLNEKPSIAPGLYGGDGKDTYAALWDQSVSGGVRKVGKGRIIQGGWKASSLDELGIAKDLIAFENDSAQAKEIAWTHRRGDDYDVYFLSNQQERKRSFRISLNLGNRVPELWNPVSGEMMSPDRWVVDGERTVVPVSLEANESVFIVLADRKVSRAGRFLEKTFTTGTRVSGPWMLRFDTAFGGPLETIKFDSLGDWSLHPNPSIRYYSGTAVYTKVFQSNLPMGKTHFIDLGKVNDIATVYVNGIDCGTAWTYPFRVDVTKALRKGSNKLEIHVTNTWANRLIGDHLPGAKPITSMTATYRLEGRPLLPAGLLGPVVVY